MTQEDPGDNGQLASYRISYGGHARSFILTLWQWIKATPSLILLLALLPLALDSLFIMRDGRDKLFLYQYAWAIAVLNGAIFLATPSNEARIKYVMISTIIGIALIVMIFFSLRVYGIQ